MAGRQALIVFVILAFGAYSLIPLYHYGYLGMLRLDLSNSATTQVALDLLIALTLVSVWIWRDAKSRHLNPVPYLLLTILTGSFGPLLYLWKRFERDQHPRPSAEDESA